MSASFGSVETLPVDRLTSAQELELPAISVKSVGKAYRSYGHSYDLLREILTGATRHDERWVLRDVSFDVPKGSVVGVVGSNGAGKSTLLKIVSGLLQPTEGSVVVNGRLSAILELGTGFHPDYTGRENIITGGMCMGMSRSEIDAKIPWIIEFSELGAVLDQPFRTYSSGMQARLTFSTAISVDPDILIVDEALAAGDSYFVNKCLRRMRAICESGASVLFVSHSTYLIIELCKQAIWIDQGRLRSFGDTYSVVKAYEKQILDQTSRNHAAGGIVDNVTPPLDTDSLSGATYVYQKTSLKITGIKLHEASGAEQYVFSTGDDIIVRIAWEGSTDAGEIASSLRIDSSRVQAVAGYTSDEDGVYLGGGRPLAGSGSFDIVLKGQNLGQGNYFVTACLKEVDFTGGDGTILFLADRAVSFSIRRKKKFPHEYVSEIDYELIEHSSD